MTKPKLQVGEQLSPANDCLLVFIDDTGNESMVGEQAYFGLGGIMLLAGENESLLKPSWKAVRLAVTGSQTIPLHASDMTRDNNPKHIQAVANFFREQQFLRFAVGTNANATVPTQFSKRQPVYEILKKWVATVAEASQCSSVALIFESSQRADPILRTEFGTLAVARNGIQLPVEYCLMPKAAGEPALEVADFVANAAGGVIRKGAIPKRPFPADFRAVFHSVPDSRAKFMFIAAVQGTESNEAALGLELRTPLGLVRPPTKK